MVQMTQMMQILETDMDGLYGDPICLVPGNIFIGGAAEQARYCCTVLLLWVFISETTESSR